MQPDRADLQKGLCEACVDDGWFKQPPLPRVRLFGLWGWVRLPSCCTLRDQCAQVKSAITTHTQLNDNIERQVMYHGLRTHTKKTAFSITTLRPSCAHLGGGPCSNRYC